jgi:hypothetical protein
MEHEKKWADREKKAHYLLFVVLLKPTRTAIPFATTFSTTTTTAAAAIVS